MADELFSDTTTIDSEKNYLEDLVGEGKKFTSVEELARGKAESDLFIERIKAENAQLREEVNARKTMEEVLDRLNSSNGDTQNRNSDTNLEEDQGSNNVDVESLVEQALNQRLSQFEKQNTAKQNMSVVTDALRNKFGNNFQTVLKDKVAELGIGEDFATNLAETHPKAFLELVGAAQATPQAQSQETVRTVPRRGGSAKNYAYYEDLRRTNPDKYYSAATHSEMLEALAEQGDDFYLP